MDLHRGGHHQPRVRVRVGKLLGEFRQPRSGELAGIVNPGDQAIGLHQALPCGGQRNAQPAVQEVRGVLKVSASAGGASRHGVQILCAGVRSRVADRLEGLLVEFVCTGAACGLGGMDLRAGQLLREVFGEHREVGRVPGGKIWLGKRCRGRGGRAWPPRPAASRHAFVDAVMKPACCLRRGWPYAAGDCG